MKSLQHIAMIICLVAVPEALGMRKLQSFHDQNTLDFHQGMHKLKNMRDKSTFGFYTDAKMHRAIRTQNKTRIIGLLKRAEIIESLTKISSLSVDTILYALRKGEADIIKLLLSKKVPLTSQVLNKAIEDNSPEIINLLLENNVPIDSNAITCTINLNSMGLLEVGEIKNILELLLSHNAPLDTSALEDTLTWNLDDWIEPLLQHNAPISDAAIGLALERSKDNILTLFAKYNPDMCSRIQKYTKNSTQFYNLLPRIIWYMDTTTLADLPLHYAPDHLRYLIRWLVGKEDFPTWSHDTTYFFACILKMPRITLPDYFAQLLETFTNEELQKLINEAPEMVLETNQKALASCINALCEKRRCERFMKHSMYENAIFTFK